MCLIFYCLTEDILEWYLKTKKIFYFNYEQNANIYTWTKLNEAGPIIIFGI